MMKFNWRANWEILLVLVIIAVGIVITTIAAIRNKDKPLIVFSEESDFLASAAGAGLSEATPVVPQLTDPNGGGEKFSDDDRQSTRKPQPQLMIKSPRPSTLHQVVIRDNNYSGSNSHRNPTSGHHDGRHTKYEDTGEYSRPALDSNEQNQITTATPTTGGQDFYDALSTESTPSQIRNEPAYISVSQPSSHPTRNRVSTNGRRHVNRINQTNDDAQMVPPYVDNLSDSGDLNDDIHTTRSSLVGPNEPSSHTGGSSGSIPAPQSDKVTVTPSLYMNSPYGITSPSSSLSHLPMHKANGGKIEPSLLDTEDMMTSYSRIPTNNSSLNDALRDYNLASLLASVNSNSSQQVSQVVSPEMLAYFLAASSGNEPMTPEPFGQQSSPVQNSPRTFFNNLPISMLLNDWLKSARSKQTGAEQAGNRHQSSISQQLKSSTGPLLSLLQGITNPASSSNHDPSSISHDASDSSPHYHRISILPTDIQSILARSMRNPGPLPGFPAPKGVIETWISPTSGGDPDYHAAQDSNADFVATNVAGFVRTMQQLNAQQQISEAPNSMNQYSSKSQQYDTYQRPVPANAESMFYSQNGSQQPGSSTSSHQPSSYSNMDQVSIDQQSQQQQQEQQPGTFPSNQAPASVNNEKLWAQNNGPQFSNLVASDSSKEDSRRVYKHNQPMVAGHQQDYNGRFNNYQPHLSQPSSMSPSQPYVVNDINNRPMNQIYHLRQPQSTFNQAPVYNSRMSSEMSVPLGYSPPQVTGSAQQPSNFQLSRGSFESYSNGALESTLKASVTNSGASNNKQQVNSVQPATFKQQTQQNVVQQQSQTSTNGLNRRRRSLGSPQGPKSFIRYSTSEGDEEEDTDSRPISVVRPDGQPMNSGRIRGFISSRDRTPQGRSESFLAGETSAADHQAAQSQRNFDLFNQKNNKPHDQRNRSISDRRKMSRLSKVSKPDAGNELDNAVSNKFSHKGKLGSQRKKHVNLDTASSGLMSKLLGTASTNDETDEEFDDDDDSASEKRKEDLEDAEFGILNDGGNKHVDMGSPDSVKNSHEVDSHDNDPSLGSGSADNEAYARRNQQRSDIEFYGHPAEETRQLKYGILGSGNYEVVKGGVYSDAYESTAAVNSVANYVRKPGPLISKLFGEHEPAGAAFLHGTRTSGFMRGASAHPEELVGMVGDEIGKDLTNPLLDLIYANGGQLFEPNVVNHLGSSGSSARTIYASHEGDDSSEHIKRRNRKNGRGSIGLSSNSKLKLDSEHQEDLCRHNDDIRSSSMTSNRVAPNEISFSNKQSDRPKTQGTNQFNSYHILPSKKISIFSDKDLDSASSEFGTVNIAGIDT